MRKLYGYTGFVLLLISLISSCSYVNGLGPTPEIKADHPATVFPGTLFKVNITVRNTGTEPLKSPLVTVYFKDHLDDFKISGPSTSSYPGVVVPANAIYYYAGTFTINVSKIAPVGTYMFRVSLNYTFAGPEYDWATGFKDTFFFFKVGAKVAIKDVHFIQAVMDPKALIAGKNTIIRVDINSTLTQDADMEVKVVYDFGTKSYTEYMWVLEDYVYKSYEILLKPGLNRLYMPGGPVAGPDIDLANANPLDIVRWEAKVDGKNFDYFTWSHAGVDHDIEITVNVRDESMNIIANDTKRVGQKVVESSGLKILCVPVYFPETRYNTPFEVDMREQIEFLKKVFPIAEKNFIWDQSPCLAWTGSPPNKLESYTKEEDEWLYYNLAKPLSEYALSEGYDRVVIVMKCGYNDGGTALGMLRRPSNNVPVLISYSKIYASEILPYQGLKAMVIAHQLGHTCYLWHPKELGPDVSETICWDKLYYEKIVTDLMTPTVESEDFWIDEVRYDLYKPRWNIQYKTYISNLLTQFTGVDPKIILVDGTIYRNGTVKADQPWYILQQGQPDLTEAGTGNYQFRLLDKKDTVLGNFYFNASFTRFIEANNTLVEAESDKTSLLFRIPYVEGMSKIEICDSSNNVLATRIISLNSPSIAVTYPNGGETLVVGDDYTIRWQASDSDGDNLTYTITYSIDNGNTWFPLGLNVKGNSYVWHTSDLSNCTTFKVKVIANDGFNTVEDASNAVFSTIKITRAQSTIKLSFNQNTSILGDTVTITGSITPPVQGATVNIEIKSPSGTTVTNSSVTNTSGAFTYTFKPTDKGTWKATAKWLGNMQYLSADSSTVSISVNEKPAANTGVPSYPTESIFIGVLLTFASLTRIKKLHLNH